MLLAYLDESHNTELYCIPALMLSDQAAADLSSGMDELMNELCSEYDSIFPDTEFHSTDIFYRRNGWESLPELNASFKIYQRIVDVIVRYDISIACRGVNIDGLKRRYFSEADAHDVALTFTLERIQKQARDLDSKCLVIADEIGAKQSLYRRNFKWYQQHGTWGPGSIKLDRLIDTVHFAPSKTSRLLQAADIMAYAWLKKEQKSIGPRAKKYFDDTWNKFWPKVYMDSVWNPRLTKTDIF